MVWDFPVTGAFQPAPEYGRLGDYLEHYTAIHPQREAVVFGQRRLTYSQLREQVDRCALALLAAGVGRGERVAMLCTPRLEFWITFLATLRVGAVWTGMTPGYSTDEIRYVLEDCQPKLLFSLTAFEGRDFAADLRVMAAENPGIDSIVTIADDPGHSSSFEAFITESTTISQRRYTAAVAAVNAADAAMIVYTSGTTGRPKGAVLSHWGLAGGAAMQTGYFGVECPVMVVNFPINHVACAADTCATTLVKGGKIIFQQRFDPAATLEAVQRERCNILAGVPTMLQRQLGLPGFGSYDLSSLELIVWGGAAMPADGVARLREVTRRLLPAYGLSETATNVVYGEASASNEVLATTIGKPAAGVQCRIVGDDGATCGPGEPGELQFKAGFFFLGYWNRPAATRAAYAADGWFKSGDIGCWTADGNIRLVGRKTDMFKSGGYNVYPREIEIVLETLPEVSLAAVIGVPDDLYQEVGHAFILLQPGRTLTTEDLRLACAAKLANYKIPKKFNIENSLPLLPVGKIDKLALRALAADAIE